MWVGEYEKLTNVPLKCDCNPEEILPFFYTVMTALFNSIKDERFYFPEVINKRDLIFSMPAMDIIKFLDFKKDSNKKMIYYHNRMGHTTHTKPFEAFKDHIYILTTLALKFPEIIFLVPNNELNPGFPNIVSTQTFGVIENNTCKNVLEDISIAGNCDSAFLFDMGSAFTHCNSQFPTYKATFYHVSRSSEYAHKIKRALEYSLAVPTHNIEYIYASLPEDVINIVSEKINRKE